MQKFSRLSIEKLRQEELARKAREHGMEVTQATVSRDIKIEIGKQNMMEI